MEEKPSVAGQGDSRANQQAHHHGSFERLILAKALTPRSRVHATQGRFLCVASIGEHSMVRKSKFNP